MSEGELLSIDPLLDEMRDARKGPAVLKMRLVTLRGETPHELVFVFEGDEDKGVYFQWIRAIASDLSFEPFPCKGKSNVLDLLDILKRDLNNLEQNVYFFVDRDFDDLRGHAPSESVFMTDHYSVENYLVTLDVLAELLKNDFHCHAQPVVRAEVMRNFEAAYASHIAATRDLNFRLFVARRVPIKLTKNLPSKISHIADVRIADVEPSAKALADLVVMEREPTNDEIGALQEEFDALDGATRYRGKFALMFFMKWLSLLAEQRRDADGLFEGLDKDVKVRLETITIEMLASKSTPPPELRGFLKAIQEARAA